MTAVEARSVTRRFGGFLAVDQVDLTVERGEVVGVLGANGAGKTTLIRMILGLLNADGGSIRLFGRPPSRETRRRTGYVPQGLGLYRDLTAAENLAFIAASFGVKAQAALQHHPDLLVLDEPTSGVAPLTRARLWDRIREQALTGTAVLVTTHYMDEARQADRLVLMARGRVIGRGEEADLVGDTRAVVVRTDRWAEAFSVLEAGGLTASLVGREVRVPGADPDAVRRTLTSAGLSAAVEIAPATLEEAMVLSARDAGP
jgi:ABC-2 type transport system ATP-binding protein